MGSDLKTIIEHLAEQYNGPGPVIRPPYLYLDPKAVLYLYQELTGLREAPHRVEAFCVAPHLAETQTAAGIEIRPEYGQGHQIPLHILYEAMEALIDSAVPEVKTLPEVIRDGSRLIRTRGRLQTTHFPDGNLNLEITFAGVRGLVFYTEGYFNSLTRPLLHNDRFFAMDENVEALLYLLGPVQRIIFYHQAYGDNQEYDWLPVAPVVIRNVRTVEEASGQP